MHYVVDNKYQISEYVGINKYQANMQWLQSFSISHLSKTILDLFIKRKTNRHNSLPCTVRTSRQRSCIKRVGCLLCSMAKTYDLCDGSLDKRKMRSLFPCCGKDGYRAQVSKHPIYIWTHTYILLSVLISIACYYCGIKYTYIFQLVSVYILVGSPSVIFPTLLWI